MTKPMDQMDENDRAAVKPGTQLGHYRIEGVVAHGCAATTFRATDLLTNQPVAIEIPRPEIEADPVLLERFQRDEDLDKSRHYPGLVKLIEKHRGDPGKGQTYLVREWFEGISLRALLSQGKLAQGRAIQIALSICGAAEYMHSRGTILRDLEPENILVGANDQIKLIHIGMSSKVGARRLTITKLSQVVGASKYASPEEMLGMRADTRSDIYSIGTMLYEMATGRAAPFPGPK